MQDQEDCDGLSEHSESSLFICEIQLWGVTFSLMCLQRKLNNSFRHLIHKFSQRCHCGVWLQLDEMKSPVFLGNKVKRDFFCIICKQHRFLIKTTNFALLHALHNSVCLFYLSNYICAHCIKIKVRKKIIIPKTSFVEEEVILWVGLHFSNANQFQASSLEFNYESVMR